MAEIEKAIDKYNPLWVYEYSCTVDNKLRWFYSLQSGMGIRDFTQSDNLIKSSEFRQDDHEIASILSIPESWMRVKRTTSN